MQIIVFVALAFVMIPMIQLAQQPLLWQLEPGKKKFS